MKNIVDGRQKSAIIIGEKLAQYILANPDVSENLLENIKNIPADKTHADIAKEILLPYPKADLASDQILRTAVRKALQVLLTEDEYQKIVTKANQRSGNLHIADLHENNGTTMLSDGEKEMLEQIGKRAEEYKRNTVRDIKKIQTELINAGHPMRNASTIWGHLKQFQNSIKTVISRKEHPEETADLEKLFKEHYSPGKKVPRKKITKELNEIYHHNRSEESIGKYIKENLKTPEERAAMASEIRPDDEQEFIRNIIKNQKEYRYPGNTRRGGYILNKIAHEFLAAFPDSSRSPKAIKHQIEKQKKLMMREKVVENM